MSRWTLFIFAKGDWESPDIPITVILFLLQYLTTLTISGVLPLKEMEQNNITQLIVIKREKYLGVIHIHDIIKEGIISQWKKKKKYHF